MRGVPRVQFVEQPCKSVLNRVEGMPFKWSINPYSGCAHACTYCYARAFYTRADRGSAADFERVIYVKVNAPEVLRQELARRTWRRELVVVGAATDPYQPAEGKYRITRRILEALLAFRTPVSLITKGTLVVRDADVLAQLAAGPGAEVNVTIGTLDPAAWRALEPGTPPPWQRLAAVRRLAAAGVPVGVFLAPIMPGINDGAQHLGAVVQAAAEAGAQWVVPLTLRLAPGVREWFLPALSRHYPRLTVPYVRLFEGTEPRADYRQQVVSLARRLVAAAGLAGAPPRSERPPATATAAQQLRLSL